MLDGICRWASTNCSWLQDEPISESTILTPYPAKWRSEVFLRPSSTICNIFSTTCWTDKWRRILPGSKSSIGNYLNSIRDGEIVTKGLEMSAALANVYKRILKLSRQVPVSHCRDTHRIEFLQHSIIGYSWSQEPLSIAMHKLSFQPLYGRLKAAM